MNELRESDVFGLQYLEDVELETNDVVGCQTQMAHDVDGVNR